MKSKFQLALLFVIGTSVFISCSAPAEKENAIDLAKVKSDIQTMEDAYAAAERAKDAAGVVVYYSEDAVSYSRNQQPVSGKAAIREDIAQRLAKDTTGNHNVYKVVDLFAEGDMAVEIGSWTSVNSSGAEVDKGYYMSYFQKRDGKYVCVRDMNMTTSAAK